MKEAPTRVPRTQSPPKYVPGSVEIFNSPRVSRCSCVGTLARDRFYPVYLCDLLLVVDGPVEVERELSV